MQNVPTAPKTHLVYLPSSASMPCASKRQHVQTCISEARCESVQPNLRPTHFGAAVDQ